MSGVGGDVGQLEELLIVMKAARDDFDKARDEKKEQLAQQEEKKERLGVVIRQRATKRHERETDDTGDAGEHGSAPNSAKKKPRKNAFNHSIDHETEMFTAALEKRDAERIALKAERFQLERDRFEAEKLKRQLDREERAKERDTANKSDLEKFRLMMDMLRQTQPQQPATGGSSMPSKEAREALRTLRSPLRWLHWGITVFTLLASLDTPLVTAACNGSTLRSGYRKNMYECFADACMRDRADPPELGEL